MQTYNIVRRCSRGEGGNGVVFQVYHTLVALAADVPKCSSPIRIYGEPSPQVAWRELLFQETQNVNLFKPRRCTWRAQTPSGVAGNFPRNAESETLPQKTAPYIAEGKRSFVLHWNMLWRVTCSNRRENVADIQSIVCVASPPLTRAFVESGMLE